MLTCLKTDQIQTFYILHLWQRLQVLPVVNHPIMITSDNVV